MTKTIADRKAKLTWVDGDVWELNTTYPIMAELTKSGTATFTGTVRTSTGLFARVVLVGFSWLQSSVVQAAITALKEFKSSSDLWEWCSLHPTSNVWVLFYKDQPMFIQVLYSGEKFKAKGGAVSSHYVLLYGPDHQHHLSQYDYCVWPEVLKIVEEKYLPRLVDQEITFLEKFL